MLLNYCLHDKKCTDFLEMHPRGDLDPPVRDFPGWGGGSYAASCRKTKEFDPFFLAHGATAGWTSTCSASARKLDTS